MAMALPCDCHVHVFDPARFAYAAFRKFTPDTADAQQLAAYLNQAGMARVVLVQPSVYGTDNRCVVDAMARLGGRAKGVAVVAPDEGDAELNALSNAGVVGARLNMVVERSDNAVQAIRAIETLDAMLPESWHIQLHISLGVLANVAQAIGRTKRLFVLDHLGLPAVQEGTQAPLWQAMLGVVRAGQLCVKLSGPYLASRLASPYPDLQPFVESLAQTRSESLLWGSNWPHTQGGHRSASGDPFQVEPFREEDPLAWPQACAQWLGPSLHAQLQRNAAEVYGFEV